jgi:hypothetical protein
VAASETSDERFDSRAWCSWPEGAGVKEYIIDARLDCRERAGLLLAEADEWIGADTDLMFPSATNKPEQGRLRRNPLKGSWTV